MWLYNNQEFKETPEEFQGFVYCITELNTGMMYIGKKFFWKPKVLPVNKTRKRRVRTRVESDWRNYYGSNKFLRQMAKITINERFLGCVDLRVSVRITKPSFSLNMMCY